jgi:hypothetical protein
VQQPPQPAVCGCMAGLDRLWEMHMGSPPQAQHQRHHTPLLGAGDSAANCPAAPCQPRPAALGPQARAPPVQRVLHHEPRMLREQLHQQRAACHAVTMMRWVPLLGGHPPHCHCWPVALPATLHTGHTFWTLRLKDPADPHASGCPPCFHHPTAGLPSPRACNSCCSCWMSRTMLGEQTTPTNRAGTADRVMPGACFNHSLPHPKLHTPNRYATPHLPRRVLRSLHVA